MVNGASVVRRVVKVFKHEVLLSNLNLVEKFAIRMQLLKNALSKNVLKKVRKSISD